MTEADDLTPEKFRYFCGKKLSNSVEAERLLDVMIWNGSLGVMDSNGPKYIFDSGYKRQYLAAKIKADKLVPLVIHPTLLAAIA